MKILIVDDAALMRIMLRNILAKAGHQVIGEASNGVEALGLLKVKKPDLIMLDITMPEMDGIATLEKIKVLNQTAKVIMCSALGQENIVKSAIKLGAEDFIIKPFDEERILEAIKKITI